VKSTCIATLLKLRTRCTLFVAAMFLTSFAAYAAPGDLDPTFGVGGKLRVAPSQGAALNTAFALEPSGKILFVGNRIFGPSFSPETFRILQNGEIDRSYIPGFSNQGSYFVNAILVLSDGSSVSGGNCYPGRDFPTGKSDFCLIKRGANGALDQTWGTGGVVTTRLTAGFNSITSLALQATGEIVAAGVCRSPANNDFCIARYSANGVLDTAFNSSGYTVFDVGQGADSSRQVSIIGGQIVVVGTCSFASVDAICAARINSDGSLDTTFNASGKKVFFAASGPDSASGLTANNGGYLVSGRCTLPGGQRFCIVRLNLSGSIDSGFASAGVLDFGPAEQTAENRVFTQTDEKFVVGATCGTTSSSNFCLRRYESSGAFDSTFAGGALKLIDIAQGDKLDTMVIDPDGKVLLGGACDGEFCLARLKGGPYDASTCTLNADLNNQVAGNDGVLAIRYLLGYTGNALTDGALGANPGRTAQQIESHLAQLKTDGKLDVDGDGEVNAMTDGLLILRAMLGLSGDALIAGARNASHPNVRDAKQILTWIELTHGVACLP
jgi:uncharacterized delta-60 repeat protein